MLKPPILYSFRRCPYAIRERLALKACDINVIIREVDLKNKPTCLIKANPNGTVPTLIINENQILNQSLDIVAYCDQISGGTKINLEADSEQHYKILLNSLPEVQQSINILKYQNEENKLDHAKRIITQYLNTLSKTLCKKKYLVSDSLSKADINIVPFIRQINSISNEYFDCHINLKTWLQRITESEIFNYTMQKFPIWQPNQAPIIF